MGQTPQKSETRDRPTPSYPQTTHTTKQEAEQLDPTQEIKQVLQMRNRGTLHCTVPTPEARQL